MALVTDYTALIPSANANKPKFMAMVAAGVQPFVDAINFYEGMLASNFTLATALGPQLTTLGLWVGLSRYINVEVQAWFAFDTANFGWDQGVWWIPGEALTGNSSYDDTTFRALIYAKIAWNLWDGTTPTFYALLVKLFPSSTVTIADNLNNSIGVNVHLGTVNQLLKQAALDGLLPFVPAGIKVTYTFS